MSYGYNEELEKVAFKTEFRFVHVEEISQFISVAKKENILFNKETRFYAVFIDGEVAAFSGIIWYKHKAKSCSSYVLREFRGRGIFKLMMDYTIKLMKEAGTPYLEGVCTEMSINELLKRGAYVTKEYKHFKQVRLDL
jgi:GNAT superfamily N-acetyltransferase